MDSLALLGSSVIDAELLAAPDPISLTEASDSATAKTELRGRADHKRSHAETPDAYSRVADSSV